MKVKELVELLSKADPEMEVKVSAGFNSEDLLDSSISVDGDYVEISISDYTDMVEDYMDLVSAL